MPEGKENQSKYLTALLAKTQEKFFLEHRNILGEGGLEALLKLPKPEAITKLRIALMDDDMPVEKGFWSKLWDGIKSAAGTVLPLAAKALLNPVSGHI